MPHPRTMWDGPAAGALVSAALAGALLLGPGCGRQRCRIRIPQPPGALTGQDALTEVLQFIQVGPRPSGSLGARRAAEYIAQRLDELGLASDVDTFTDPTPVGPTQFRNVTATIATRTKPLPSGVRPTVVLLSHYDTKAHIADDFIGANDSGSSTGLLLALAAFYRTSPPPCDVMLAFVDGEECMRRYGATDGLHGSRRLASRLRAPHREVLAVFVLDMIGDRDLAVSIPRDCSPALTSLVFESAHEEDSRGLFGLATVGILDDHVPLLAAGFPVVNLIDFTYGATPSGNEYWHTPLDTADKLSADSLQTVGRVVIRAINKVAERQESI